MNTDAKIDRMAIVISAAVPIQRRRAGIAEFVNLTIPTLDFDKVCVKIPEVGRDDSEVAVARRYPLHPQVAVSARRPLPDTWIHRSVQRAPGVTVSDEAETDEILYTIYSTNVSILGARQTDQLITILLNEYDAAEFTSTETEDALGTLRLRVFAVIKAITPPRHEDYYIDFSPIAAVTAVITPLGGDRKSNEQMLRVYASLDTARVTVEEKAFSNIVTLLTASLADRFLSNYHFVTQRDIEDLRKIPERDGAGGERTAELEKRVRILRIRSLAVGGFQTATDWGTRYFLGTVMRCETESATALLQPARPTNRANDGFFALFQGMLAPGLGFNEVTYKARLESTEAITDLKAFVRDCLPEDSYMLASRHSIGILAPGRRIELVYEDRGREAMLQKRFRQACAWNVLSLSLIAMQEALLASYHRSVGDERVSAKRLTQVAESAVRDFADYYDVALFKSSASAFFRDAYERMQKVNGLDHEYTMLRERLGLVLAKNNGEAVVGVQRTLRVTWLGIALALVVAVVSSMLAIRSSSSEEIYLKGIQRTLTLLKSAAPPAQTHEVAR